MSSSTSSSSLNNPSLYTKHFDVQLLLTGRRFTDPVEYIAIPDSICTPRAIGIIQVSSNISSSECFFLYPFVTCSCFHTIDNSLLFENTYMIKQSI